MDRKQNHNTTRDNNEILQRKEHKHKPSTKGTIRKNRARQPNPTPNLDTHAKKQYNLQISTKMAQQKTHKKLLDTRPSSIPTTSLLLDNQNHDRAKTIKITPQ